MEVHRLWFGGPIDLQHHFIGNMGCRGDAIDNFVMGSIAGSVYSCEDALEIALFDWKTGVNGTVIRPQPVCGSTW